MIPSEPPYIVQALTKENEGDLREALSIIYRNFWRLIREQNFTELDNQIEYCSIKWVTLDVGLAVLTASAPHKSKARSAFYTGLRKKFKREDKRIWEGLK